GHAGGGADASRAAERPGALAGAHRRAGADRRKPGAAAGRAGGTRMTGTIARVGGGGLGPLGREMGHALQGRQRALMVGAADPAYVGTDVGELSGVGRLGMPIVASAAEAYASAGGNLALLCTSSRLRSIGFDVETAIQHGYAVVSTCEELAWPFRADPGVAERIDQLARRRGVAVLGVGVNPGLVMDRLPLALAAACGGVDSGQVERVADAAERRAPLRDKVGAGLRPAEFTAGVAAGRLGHVGLAESVALLARGLGFSPIEIRESIEPVLSSDAA